MEGVKSIVEYFSEVPDPRRRAGQRHEQTFVLLVTLMSIMSGYIGYRAIGDFIKRNKEALLEHFKPKEERLPSFYTVRRVLLGIDFQEVSRQFHKWALQYVSIGEGEWVSIDGKALGGTIAHPTNSHQAFISLVSLYCSKQQLILGNAQVSNAKQSEITVVQQLLEALDLKGVTFTLDALHCQKKQRKPLRAVTITT
jgi:hypothetical protein